MEQIEKIFDWHRIESQLHSLFDHPETVAANDLSELKLTAYDDFKNFLSSKVLLGLIKSNDDVSGYFSKLRNVLNQVGVKCIVEEDSYSKLTALFAESAINGCGHYNTFEEISIIIKFLVKLMSLMNDVQVVDLFKFVNLSHNIALLEEYLLLVMNAEYGEDLDLLSQFAFELYHSKSVFNKNNFIMLLEISTNKLKSEQLNSESKIRILGLIIEVVNNSLYSEFLKRQSKELTAQLKNLKDLLIDFEGEEENPMISCMASSLLEKLHF